MTFWLGIGKPQTSRFREEARTATGALLRRAIIRINLKKTGDVKQEPLAAKSYRLALKPLDAP
jgi:hypothetical protein